MKVFLVLAHPEPKSFNGALFDTACRTFADTGHEVLTSRLYEDGFNPVSDRRNFTTVADPAFLKLQLEEMHATTNHGFAPDLEAEMRKLEACDLLILQFPLWWFGMPAILKGWVDRVMAAGRFYGGGRSYDAGVLRRRRALVSTTTGGPVEAYRPGGGIGDMLGILRPIHRGVLAFVGFDVLAPQIHGGPARVADAIRKSWLAAWEARLRAIESESPIDVGEY